LNDIPNGWSGLAGDLFSSSSAKLRFGKAVELGRKEGSSFTQIEYGIQGTLELGERKYRLTGAQLWLTAGVSDRAEVSWLIEDPLVPSLLTLVRFLPQQNSFELFETLEGRRGERRFLLQAPASLE
jgi:hypothetical protein